MLFNKSIFILVCRVGVAAGLEQQHPKKTFKGDNWIPHMQMLRLPQRLASWRDKLGLKFGPFLSLICFLVWILYWFLCCRDTEVSVISAGDVVYSCRLKGPKQSLIITGWNWRRIHYSEKPGVSVISYLCLWKLSGKCHMLVHQHPWHTDAQKSTPCCRCRGLEPAHADQQSMMGAFSCKFTQLFPTLFTFMCVNKHF